MGVAEDLAENTEIINRIKGALLQAHEDCEAYKQVLLKLDVETNRSDLFDRYGEDPDNPDFSFDALLERAKRTWAQQQATLRDQVAEKARLQQRCESMKEKLRNIAGEDGQLKARQEVLERQVAELDRFSVQIEEQLGLHKELHCALHDTRQQVRWMEAELRGPDPAAESEVAQGRRCCRPRRPALGNSEAQLFIIAAGHQDNQSPFLEPRPSSRCEGCRRSCQIM